MQKMQSIFRGKCSAGKIPVNIFVYTSFVSLCCYSFPSFIQKITVFTLFRSNAAAFLYLQPLPIRVQDSQKLVLGIKNAVFR